MCHTCCWTGVASRNMAQSSSDVITRDTQTSCYSWCVKRPQSREWGGGQTHTEFFLKSHKSQGKAGDTKSERVVRLMSSSQHISCRRISLNNLNWMSRATGREIVDYARENETDAGIKENKQEQRWWTARPSWQKRVEGQPNFTYTDES